MRMRGKRYRCKLSLIFLSTFFRVPLVLEGLADTGRIAKADITKQDALKGVRILEAGCGGGVLAEDLARLGAYVVGVDPGKEMIDLAKTHLDTKSSELKNLIEYHDITVEEHVKKFAGTYDAIVCSEVMEHVDEKESILAACCRCLKVKWSMSEGRRIKLTYFCLVAWWIIVRYYRESNHVGVVRFHHNPGVHSQVYPERNAFLRKICLTACDFQDCQQIWMQDTQHPRVLLRPVVQFVEFYRQRRL